MGIANEKSRSPQRHAYRVVGQKQEGPRLNPCETRSRAVVSILTFAGAYLSIEEPTTNRLAVGWSPTAPTLF